MERLFALSSRSNQFNVTLRRSQRADFAQVLEPGSEVQLLGIELTDRFSRSGVVGAVLTHTLGDHELHVDELFLSCRVLGRGLENTMLAGALARLAASTGASSINIPWARGPRNSPALAWLATLAEIRAGVDCGISNVSVAAILELSEPSRGVSIRESL